MQRSANEFKADIQDFHTMKNKIQTESPNEIVLFLSIDCQPIKQVTHLHLITLTSKYWHRYQFGMLVGCRYWLLL